jgi:hypothetical protein
MRHGLCANCIVVEGESRENFLILLQQHVDRFRPADEVEFGMIEEMCASYWRQRRAWSLETGMFNKQMALQPDGGMMDQMVVAFDTLAASHSLSLLHRYETRLHLTYQRALRTLIMVRSITRPDDEPPSEDAPNEPSPISEHPPDAAPAGPSDVGQPILAAAGIQPAPHVRQASRPVVSPRPVGWAHGLPNPEPLRALGRHAPVTEAHLNGGPWASHWQSHGQADGGPMPKPIAAP